MRTAVLLVLAALAAPGCGRKDRDREAPARTEPVPPAARTTPRPAPRPATDARVDLISRCWAGVDSGDPARACFATDALPPRASFPDLQHKLGSILVAGDQAVVTFVAQGSNRAAFRGRPPSYNSIGLLGAQHLRLAGGKITGSTIYLHGQSLLGQIGMLPPHASYRAVASAGQTRTVIASDDATEKANLTAVTAIEAALAAGTIADAVAAFAPDGRFIYVPGAADAVGAAALAKRLAIWREQVRGAPAAAPWTLAAGEQVAIGTDDELHLYRLAGGKVTELWVYGAATARQPPAP
jgi:hypothetical protein